MADIVYQHPELVTDSDKQYLPPRVGGFSRSSKKYIYKYHDNSFAEIPSISWLAGLGDESNPANRVKVQWEGVATTVKEALTELNSKIASVLALIPSNIASFKYFGHITDLSLNIGTGYGYLLGSEVSGLDFLPSERVLLQSFSHTENVSQGAGIASPYLQQKIGGITSGKEYYRLGTINPNDGTVSFSAWSTTQRSYVDTATVSADITTANTVKFNAKISSVANNKLSEKSDGLYATQTLPDPNGDSRYVLNGAGSWFQALGNDGLLRADLMPPLAIKETFVVTSQAAMLALTAQRGDVAIRTDVTPNEYYILSADTPSVLSAWKGPVSSPLDGVQSINGKAGSNITLDHADLFNLNADSTKLHVTQAEKDSWSGKAAASHTHSSLVPENTNEININSFASGSILWWAYRGATNTITKHAFSQGKANGALARLDIADATESTNAVTKSQLDTKEPTITAGTTSQYYRGDKSWQTLNKSAVGLGNVDNTTDANKPISTATQTALDGKSPTSHTHQWSGISGGLNQNISNTNLNDLATSGLYAGVTLTNNPWSNGDWWYIQSDILPQDSNWRHQEAKRLYGTAASDVTVTWRHRIGDGTWSPWVTAWHSGNFDPSTKSSTSHTHSHTSLDGGVAIDYSSSDLSALSGNGHYRGSNMSSAPDSGWWWIESRRHGNESWRLQIAYPFGTGAGNTSNSDIFWRKMSQDAWQEWHKFWTSGNLTNPFGDKGTATDANSCGMGVWRLNTSIPNQPGGTSYGTLVSFDNTSDTGFQLACGYSGSRLHFRGGNGSVYGGSGSFESWREIWHDGNFNPSNKSDVGHGHTWSNINSGISSSVDGTDLNNLKTAGIFRGSNLTNAPFSAEGNTGWWHIIVSVHDTNWVMQQVTIFGISFAYNGVMESDSFIRTCNSGTWSSWKRVFNSGNISKDAGALRCNGWDNYPGFDANAQGTDLGVHFTYANNAPVSGALWYIGNGNYGTQFNTSYLSDRFYFRNRNGDNGSWTGWREVWHTGNFDPSTKANTSHNHNSAYVARGGASISTIVTNLGAGVWVSSFNWETRLDGVYKITCTFSVNPTVLSSPSLGAGYGLFKIPEWTTTTSSREFRLSAEPASSSGSYNSDGMVKLVILPNGYVHLIGRSTNALSVVQTYNIEAYFF